MTDYAGYLIPLPELYQQDLTDSLDDGLDRWDGFAGIDLPPLEFGTLTHTGSLVRDNTVNHAGFVLPTYADDLFGHIIIVPARLDLGNLLSNQQRELEVANLFYIPRDWTALINDAGDGIEFDNLPAFPHTILPFGSYTLTVSVSPDGPAVIDGDLIFEFDYDQIPVPVTGQRIVMFQFIPQANAVETIEWSTDIIESYDATEQRVRVRLAPRQRIQYEVLTEAIQDMYLRSLLFDWLPRVWGVPIWFEKRDLQSFATAGDNVLQVSTLYGDFRVDSLVMIWADNDTWEALEVEAFDDSSITTSSVLLNSYAAGAFVMPVRTAYMQTQTNSQRYHDGFERTTVNFTTLDNEDLADATGATIYDTRVLLEDGNLVADTIGESMDRPVVVIDNLSGRLLQTSRSDRSRLKTAQVWDAPSPAELWRIRRLLHYFHGSQRAFFVPSCRADLVISDVIGPGAMSFRILLTGFTSFIQSRRPLADIRILLNDGTKIHRRVIGSEIDEGEEVLTVDSPISATAIALADIARCELLMLVRIDNDEAVIEHRRVGDATISLQLISTKG